jgi:aminoglycoside 6'-N-acetyltransferase
MDQSPVLAGRRVRLRLVRASDREALRAIRSEPGVRRWWGELEPGEDPTEAEAGGERFAIEVDGAVAGAIQYGENTDPMYRSAGIDVFLGAAFEGRGLAREAIGLLVRYLIEVRGHHRLTIDPAAANARAIRCYEAVGFTTVGVMREYERGDDGVWHDGLLMELLAADWRGAGVPDEL